MPTQLPPPYSPDDASISLPTLEFLHSDPGHALLTQIRTLLDSHPNPSVSDIAQFRKLHPPEIVHAAFALARAQKKAVGPQGKFPHLPFLWCVPEALEQATDSAVANHKANRFAQLPNLTHITDLCAGIGGDTLSLANIAPVTAIDLSPIRLACLRYNVEIAPPLFPIETITQHAHDTLLQPAPPTSAFHIDPARRSAGTRTHLYQDLIPGPDLIEKLIHHFPAGAIKLSSAVNFDSLPSGPNTHLELISHNRTVVQAILWTGALAAQFPPNTRTATAITPHSTCTFSAASASTRLASAQVLDQAQYLYEIDPAFTRAQLAQAFADTRDIACSSATIDAGYLISDKLIHHSILTPFKILTTIPFSPDRVTTALTQFQNKNPSLPPGTIEVKTRGRLPGIDTDHLQKLWSKSKPHPYTILLFQHDANVLAAITMRLQK